MEKGSLGPPGDDGESPVGPDMKDSGQARH